jgi:hypothetical protein
VQNPYVLLADNGPLVIHPLDLARPVDSEVEPYLWSSPPGDAANKGLVIKRLNHKATRFDIYSRSEVEAGSPPFTKDFAAARYPGPEHIYIFGGASASGALPDRLWRGDPVEDSGAIVYRWTEVEGSHPAGRTGALLVSDADRGRLLLMYGRDASGESLSSTYAYDIASGDWSSVDLEVTGLGPLDTAGHAVAGGKLYLFGGRRNGEARSGLYVIDLATLAGQQLDAVADPAPSARWGAAVAVNPAANRVHVFGGRHSEGARNDLWSFSLTEPAWSEVSADGADGAPPRMDRASLVVSPINGAATVLCGPLEQGSEEPFWKLWSGGWKTTAALRVSKPD